MASNPIASAAPVRVERISSSRRSSADDLVAIEEPLEIRLAFDRDGEHLEKAISITMRTPGEDFHLARGFLFGESIVRSAADISSIGTCGPPAPDSGFHNTVRVVLAEGGAVDLSRLERHFYTSSSCGVCGKTSIEALRVTGLRPIDRDGFRIGPGVIHRLPEALRERQELFDCTGGLHASALFDARGTLVAVHEDVGRHNALDKLVGAALERGDVPLGRHILMVSGRASFELVQKALVAGIPAMAAVGAPSSLAIDLARTWGMTLLGFVRDGRFNVYSGGWRLDQDEAADPADR